MHLGANTVDELGAAVDLVDEVDEAVQLSVDAVEAANQSVMSAFLDINRSDTSWTHL